MWRLLLYHITNGLTVSRLTKDYEDVAFTPLYCIKNGLTVSRLTKDYKDVAFTPL